MIAVAGELAGAAGITGWAEGEASNAGATVFRDWLAERGGPGCREDQHLVAAFRKFIALHGAARFTIVCDPKAGEQVESEPPENERTINRAGWRWLEDVAAAEGAARERRWVYGIVPEVFDAEIAAPLGMEGRDARARLGRAGLIRSERVGGELRWTSKARRLPGGARPRLIVAEPTLLETGAGD